MREEDVILISVDPQLWSVKPEGNILLRRVIHLHL